MNKHIKLGMQFKCAVISVPLVSENKMAKNNDRFQTGFLNNPSVGHVLVEQSLPKHVMCCRDAQPIHVFCQRDLHCFGRINQQINIVQLGIHYCSKIRKY